MAKKKVDRVDPQQGKTKAKKKKTAKKKVTPPVSYHRRPENMSLEAWQMALRKQYARQTAFTVQKLGPEVVFSDYQVSSESSSGSYRVALRSENNTANFCTCLDYKINRLGTCKHIEAVFAFIEKKHLKRKLKIQHQRDYSSVYLDYKSGRTIRIRIGTTAQAALQQLASAYFDSSGVLTSKGLLGFDTFLLAARQITPDFRCYEDALEYILELRQTEYRTSLIQKLEAQPDGVFKDVLTLPLFPYQSQGALFAFRQGRTIIGDEMGLGKTPQAIALAELMRRHLGISKVLILCPTSIKYQWKTEILKFTGDETPLVIEGNGLYRHRQHKESTAFYRIASYHSVLYDSAQITDSEPDLIILDEAQRLKNWRTKIAASVRKIPSRYICVLSGTPIENNLDELYGLAQLADPFALGPRHSFFDRYQIASDSGRITGYQHLGEIKALLKDRLIRRTKKEVLKQLPARIDKNLVIPITPQQMDLHREYGDHVARLVHKWHVFGFLDEQERQKLLRLLSLMRMVCDSTYLVDGESNHQTKLDELQNILHEILEIEGEKVVIFSQWERMTRLVATLLEEMQVGFRYLHGGIPSKKRGALYTDFNTQPDCRVFLSTDAGGVGLNLQSAAWLINLDIPWNPGILEQRVGRIYRFGQKKPVTILNLIAHGTIEHNLLGVLHFKKSVAEGVLDGGEETIFASDNKFRKFMETVEEMVHAPANTEEVHQATDNDLPPEPMATEEDLQLIANQQTSEPEDEEPEVAPDLPPTQEVAPQQSSEPNPRKLPQAEPAKQAASTADSPMSRTKEPGSPPPPQDVIQTGISFFSQLSRTLADPEATAQLVSSIIQTDEQTGQTYLKLPVENAQTVENTLRLLGGLLQGINKL